MHSTLQVTQYSLDLAPVIFSHFEANDDAAILLAFSDPDVLRVIDEALQPLLYVPKARMKFNLVVDKTLSGVIAVTLALAYRSFRKLGTQLPPPLFPQVPGIAIGLAKPYLCSLRMAAKGWSGDANVKAKLTD